MNIIVNEKSIASCELIRDCMLEQFQSMSYDYKSCYGNYYYIINENYIKTEDIKGGFLFLKTYHKYWWKIIYKVRLNSLEEQGCYQLFIEIPHNEGDMENVKIFIKGLEERLDDLKESLEIILVKVPKFDVYETNDIPSSYY
jgi:hypothetical protein